MKSYKRSFQYIPLGMGGCNWLCQRTTAHFADEFRPSPWVGHRAPVEVTFAEVRRHLGVETQRQWSDPAIARTTPALLGLFSLVTLWANEIAAETAIRPRAAVWYAKAEPTFSDALAAVRFRLWKETTSSPSAQSGEIANLPDAVLNRLIQAACFPA